MNVVALISLFAFVFAVFIGMAVYLRNRTGVLNRLFLCLSLWCAFTMILVEYGYNQSVTREEAMFVWRLDVLASVTLMFMVWFVLYFTRQYALLKSRVFNIVDIVFLLTVVALDLFYARSLQPPSRQSWGWLIGPNTLNISGILSYVWMCLNFGIVLFFSISYCFVAEKRERKAAVLVALGASFPAFLPIVDILRNMGYPEGTLPFQSAAIGIVCGGTFGVAALRHNLFELTPITVLEDIVTTMGDALFLLNDEGFIVWQNRAADAYVGPLPTAGAARHIGDVVKECTSDFVFEDRTERRSSEDCCPDYRDAHLISPTRPPLPVALSSSPLSMAKGHIIGCMVIARDTSEQRGLDEDLHRRRAYLAEKVKEREAELKEANAVLERSWRQLALLSETIQNAREEESTRISREIHDELGQLLTTVKINASLLLRRFSDNKDTDAVLIERFAKMLSFADQSVKSVQNISRRLRPPMLDDIGLAATLQAFVAEYERRYKISCTVRLTGMNDRRYPVQFSTGVYRIVQEALNYVTYRRDLVGIRVALAEVANTLEMNIAYDNIDLLRETASYTRKSIAIVGIKERARVLGGEFEISLHDNGGTVLNLSLPIAAREEDAGE